MAKFVALAYTAAVLAPVGVAHQLLGADVQGTRQARARQAILSELETVLGSGGRQVAESRAARLEEQLRPTFASLPQTRTGTIDAPAARYALRRLFVQRHGWQLQGLETDGGHWTEGPPTEVLAGRVPSRLRSLVEGRLDATGFSLHDLAVFGALIEEMIHGETDGRLRAVYTALKYSQGGTLKFADATGVIDIYMATYILGSNASSMTPEMMDEFRVSIEEQHPSWPQTVTFLREVQGDVRPGVLDLAFSDVEAVVEAAADRFGRWQSSECRLLKDQLMELEDIKGSGRVRLGDFYGSALHHGKWQFSETISYLRQLGAIDDSDPSMPRVIIPNYINSPSNCLASSSFYAVCCLDECEELLGHLEQKIGGPSAEPKDILTLVKSLPSASMAANRTMSAALEQRLQDVADHHGGRVQIHGRLFAQWMHHVYPRECPYPHMSGTTQPRRPEEFEVSAGYESTATDEEMRKHILAAQSAPKPAATDEDQGLCSSMWTMEEELVSPTTLPPSPGISMLDGSVQREVLRWLAVLAAVASLLTALRRTLGAVLGRSGRQEKFVLSRDSV